jgi:hypothetical protein
MEKWFADRQPSVAHHAIEGHYYLSRDDSRNHRLSAILPIANPTEIAYVRPTFILCKDGKSNVFDVAGLPASAGSR